MNASLVKGLIAGAVVATTGGAIAGYNMINRPPATAEVLNVVPAMVQVSVPREVCEDVEVTHQREPRDKNQVAGTVAGAVIGGLLGNQVGGGNGKKLATVAGAAAGAYAGNKVQERVQENNTYTTVEQQCHMVSEAQQKQVGYDVTYRVGATEGQVRMDTDPGDSIPLVNGQLAIN